MKALDLFELATRQSEYFPYTDKHLSEKKVAIYPLPKQNCNNNIFKQLK